MEGRLCGFGLRRKFYFLESQVDDFERLEYEPSQVEMLSSSINDDSVFSLDDIIKQLEETESLHAQADLLHYLHSTV